MNLKNFTLIIIAISLTACWPKDDSIIPEVIPISYKIDSIPYSIYDYQTFYSLRDESIKSINDNNAWDMGFEASTNGAQIILNSAFLWEAANLGSIEFSSINALPQGAEFNFDASSGNLDSLAITGWVDTTSNPFLYSGNLYILGKKEGLDYIAYRKMKFTAVTPTSYTMLIGNLDATIPDTVVVVKNNLVNYVTYKVAGETTPVTIEPNSTQWDIKFSTYLTVLYTNDGIPTDYIVRGTLINPKNTQIGEWYINTDMAPTDNDVKAVFNNLDATLLDSVTFSTNWDAIGYDWKAVKIDQGSNTATYKADTRMIFVIKKDDGSAYKLHFTSFYNYTGVQGYPKFEFAQIQ